METNKKEHAAELTASAARAIESPEAFEKAMTALKTGVDEKRAAYVTTVQDFLYLWGRLLLPEAGSPPYRSEEPGRGAHRWRPCAPCPCHK